MAVPRLPGIAAAIGKYPEVIAAATITGEADALLHIRAADVRHFERVVERIGAEPFVVRTRSVIVLSRLVDRPDVRPACRANRPGLAGRAQPPGPNPLGGPPGIPGRPLAAWISSGIAARSVHGCC